jgi:hypothetical protein
VPFYIATPRQKERKKMDKFTMNLQLFNEDDDFIDLGETVETAEPQAEIEHQAEGITETPTEEPKQEQTESPKVKLKYNHEEKEYSLDDVVPLAQKGLNYDKLQERLEALQADPRLGNYDRVHQLAEMYEMSDADMLDALYNQYFETTAEKQGLTVEQIKKDHELTQKERNIKAKEDALTKSDSEKAMYTNFLKQFPDIKPEDIKPETWQKVEQGMDLTTAYVEQRNHDLESRMKILEQNVTNTKKAPVAGVTTHGSAEITSTDPFEEGFDSI